jgi:hypothetical protein
LPRKIIPTGNFQKEVYLIMINPPKHVFDAENLQHEIFRAMTPGQRWEQFLSLM